MDVSSKDHSPASKLRMALSSRLLTEFNRKGLKVSGFADLARVSRSDISQLKNGRGHIFSVEKLYGMLGNVGVIVTVSIPE